MNDHKATAEPLVLSEEFTESYGENEFAAGLIFFPNPKTVKGQCSISMAYDGPYGDFNDFEIVDTPTTPADFRALAIVAAHVAEHLEHAQAEGERRFAEEEAEADRHVWPSQWLDWDTPDEPEACGYCGRLVCACLDDDEDARELDQAERYRDAISEGRRFL